MKVIKRVGQFIADMVLFTVAFWMVTIVMVVTVQTLLTAAEKELAIQEREALDAQGREAWDRYCLAVQNGERQDDLDAFGPHGGGECSQEVWEYEPADDNDPWVPPVTEPAGGGV